MAQRKPRRRSASSPEPAVRTASTDIPPAPKGADKLGAWFDEAAAAAACDFFERYLRHTEGEWAGQPFRLAPWQRDLVIRPFFGWKRADGTRLYRKLYLEVARKNGKTELAAGVSLLALLGDGEMGGQVYSMAVDKDQAKIVFNKAAVMVSLSPALQEHIDTFKTSLFCAQLMAAFKALSSVVGSKHGFSPSAAIGDEVHEWENGDLLDVVHKGMAARRQPIEVLITTAGVKNRGFGWETHELAVQIAKGEIEDPTYLVVIFAAGADDDWRDEKVWSKANPNLGISPKLEFIRAEAVAAARSPRLENAFRRFHLNQWTEQVTRWLPMHDWTACSRAPKNATLWRALEDELAGRRCWGGLDLASTQDTTSLVWVFPPDDAAGRTHVLWRFWLPSHDLKDRVKRDRAPYDKWAKAKALFLTEGNVTDYGAIKLQVEKDADRFKVQELAIDRWNATQLATELQEDGAPIVLFGQGYASMSAPSKELERLVLGHKIEHGNHPVAHAQASNVAVSTDPAGNIKPAKDKSTLRIDGVVSAVMGLGRAMVQEGPGVDMNEVIKKRGGLLEVSM